MFGRVNKSYY